MQQNCTVFTQIIWGTPPDLIFAASCLHEAAKRLEAAKMGSGGFRFMRHSRKAIIYCGKVIEKSLNFIDE